MMNLIIYVTTAVSLLSSGSQSETPSFVVNTTTVTTTTRNWVPSQPHNVSHGVSEDDSKETGVSHDPHVDSDDDSDDEKYLNPRKDHQHCNLGDDPAWLCNKDHVLDEKTAKDLNELLESLVDAKGICPCQDVSCSYTGFPMAVVVLDTIPEYLNKSQEDKEDHVKELAEKFLNDWEFNTCNDGAVTIVVANEKIVETVIGLKSEYLVPDDCQESVENATSSFFEEGSVEEGLTKLLQQYRLIILKNHPCNSDAHLKRSIVIPIIIILALIIVAVVVAVVIVIYRRRGSKDIRTEANVPLKDQQHAEKA